MSVCTATNHANRPRLDRFPCWLAITSLLAVRGLVALAIAFMGARSISDDDFARITIAQRFAVSPALDPSGTSWLPWPFWTMGAIMRVLGPSLLSARVWTEISAMSASCLLFAGGRAMGMSVRAAFAGSVLATVLPVAAVLGSAPIPELLTAALCAFALMAMGGANANDADRPSRWLAWAAIAAVGAAALSRYEAWPVAFIVAITLARRPATRWMAPWALAAPLLWIAHNHWAHRDALHFLRRVAAYRAALGASAPALHDALGYLAALVTAAPALCISLATALAVERRSLSRDPGSSRVWRPAQTGALALIVFLAVGAWTGGVPTHHLGRPLLLLWLLAAMALAHLACASVLASRHPWGAIAWIAATAIVSALQLPSELEGGIDRSGEIEVGKLLRANMSPEDRVLIATNDYGYFAIAAALARPAAAIFDRTHDPRKPTESSTLQSNEALATAVAANRIKWIVVPRETLLAGQVAVTHTAKFSIYRTDRAERP